MRNRFDVVAWWGRWQLGDEANERIKGISAINDSRCLARTVRAILWVHVYYWACLGSCGASNEAYCLDIFSNHASLHDFG